MEFSESELHSIGSSYPVAVKEKSTYPELYLLPKVSANQLLCFRALQGKSSNVLEYAYCIALDCDEFPGIFRLLLLIPQFPVTF